MQIIAIRNSVNQLDWTEFESNDPEVFVELGNYSTKEKANALIESRSNPIIFSGLNKFPVNKNSSYSFVREYIKQNGIDRLFIFEGNSWMYENFPKNG